MSTGPIEELSGPRRRSRCSSGTLTSSEALVRACLDCNGRDEPRIHAWAWLDPDQALAMARRVDAPHQERSEQRRRASWQ